MSDWTGDPDRVIVAGDWHGSWWALGVIRQAARLPPPRYLLQLGDFGFRVPSAGLSVIASAAVKAAVTIWVVDGNHEDHPGLAAAAAKTAGTSDAGGPVPLAHGVYHLPRGFRWRWHGRTWLAAGGAVSVDRAARTEGTDWWPQEQMTEEQAALIAAGGPADVLACHDRPAGVPYTYPPAPGWWDTADLARSLVHCERLQRLVDQVRPRHVMHGHLHDYYRLEPVMGHGPVEVTCLDRDGRAGNWQVLDVRSMEWEPGRVGRQRVEL